MRSVSLEVKDGFALPFYCVEASDHQKSKLFFLKKTVTERELKPRPNVELFMRRTKL